MGLFDRLTSAIPGGDEPEADSQRSELAASTQSKPEPRDDLYDGYEPQEIAERLRDMNHVRRKEALRHDTFIQEEWPEVREAIESDPELSEDYGVDGEQQVEKGGGEFCKHHPGTKVRTETYQPSETTVVQQSRATTEELNSQLDASVASVGEKTDETLTAGAARQETSNYEMTVCKADRDDCPTSRKGFFNAADDQLERQQENTQAYNQAWDQEEERANEVDRDAEQERAGHERAQSAEAEQETGEFVFDDEPQSVDEAEEQTVGEPDVEQSQEFELSR